MEKEKLILSRKDCTKKEWNRKQREQRQTVPFNTGTRIHSNKGEKRDSRRVAHEMREAAK